MSERGLESRFRKAAEAAERAGDEESAAKLRKILGELRSEIYTLAVVGEFKTGKSTLINRIFLKADVLFTDVLEATAIPTEIRYGPEKRLLVFPRVQGEKADHPFAEGKTAEGSAADREGEGEGEPIEIPDPGEADIRDQTTASTPEAREALSRKTERVVLYWPAPSLAGLAVFDTPGINAANEALAATTYRIIPRADLVLFATNARQLSETELAFLTGGVFAHGITKVMTVVTYDPKAGALPPDRQRRLKETIRAQLAAIGREEIPVEMVQLKEPQERAEKAGEDKEKWPSFRERIELESPGGKGESDGRIEIETPGRKGERNGRQMVEGVIGDLLGERPGSGPAHKGGIARFEEKLIAFIRENIRPGRQVKAEHLFQKTLSLAVMRCEAEISAIDKGEAERQEMIGAFREREASIQKEHETVTARLREDLGEIETGFTRELLQGLSEISERFIRSFEECEDVGDLQNRLNHAEGKLRQAIENLFFTAADRTKKKIEDRIREDQRAGEIAFSLDSAIAGNLDIEGGVLANVPPFAVYALDFSLFILVGPFRPVARLLMRLAAQEIPFLNRILPANVAASILKGRIRKSLNAEFARIEAELPPKIEAMFAELTENISGEWRKAAEERMGAVRRGMESAESGPKDPAQKARLEQYLAELKKLSAAGQMAPTPAQ